VSAVHARSNDTQWNHAPFVHPGNYGRDIQQQTSSSSVGSSPRAGSYSSSSAGNKPYDSSTSYTPSVDGHKVNGLHSPSSEQFSYPSSATHVYSSAPYQPNPLSPQTYSSMNQPQPYMEMSPAHAPTSGLAPSIGQYSYGPPQALQPASHSYAPSNYGGYAYPHSMAPMAPSHPVTSSMGGQMVPQPLPLPTMGSNAQPPPPSQGQQFQQQTFDTTGQIAPHGMKPRVTATLWEDEGSLCFQVEANGVCVARRDDNHFINGTKLLNVAGMTRGRRDGILKSEKTRHVVKIGPMHLKGVWYVRLTSGYMETR